MDTTRPEGRLIFGVFAARWVNTNGNSSANARKPVSGPLDGAASTWVSCQARRLLADYRREEGSSYVRTAFSATRFSSAFGWDDVDSLFTACLGDTANGRRRSDQRKARLTSGIAPERRHRAPPAESPAMTCRFAHKISRPADRACLCPLRSQAVEHATFGLVGWTNSGKSSIDKGGQVRLFSP